MKIVYKKVADLIPYEHNARVHSEDQINKLVASIKEFGFTSPILVDENNGVIAGHGRLIAAKRHGLDDVPTICLEHLSEGQRKAYILADNKLALESFWDDELLATSFSEITKLNFSLDATGFDLDEIKKILNIPEELKEVTENINPIKKTRILISINTDSKINIDEIIGKLIRDGCEVDYSGN
jgi:ParB-like chromosome segregation protein Spo0J